MFKPNFIVRIDNFQEATKADITQKLAKVDKLIKDNKGIDVKIEKESNIKTSITIYKVEVDVLLTNAFIKVAQSGENINKIIDEIIEPLIKKVKRYKSQKERWLKQKEWKDEQIDEQNIMSSFDDKVKDEAMNSDYTPKIIRKFYENDSPIHPAEAIERMELLGHDSFLFKNIENQRYAMIYRRESGGYGLIQPIS